MMSRTYYFIRHAVPENDAAAFQLSEFERDMRGQQDHSLSELGREQARRRTPSLAGLGVERIVSSNLKRAIETAEILSDGSGVPYDGQQWADAAEIAPGMVSPRAQDRLRRFSQAPMPPRLSSLADSLLYQVLSTYFLIQWRRGRTHDGDSRAEVVERIGAVLARLDQMPEQCIALVGHGYWITSLTLDVTRPSARKLLNIRWINNCSVTRVTTDSPGVYELDYFARTRV